MSRPLDGLTPAEAEAMDRTLQDALEFTNNRASMEALLANPEGFAELEAAQRRFRAVAASMFLTGRVLNQAGDAIEAAKRRGRKLGLRA